MIGLKTWNWLRVEVIACGISWSELEKQWNLQGWSTKKPHSLVVLFFGYRIFKGCNTLLWNHTWYDLWFCQDFQDRSICKGVSSTTVTVFFLEQITDRYIDLLFWVLRYPAHCTGLERLPEPPQNKIFYRLRPKYTLFSWFPIIWLSANWKSLLFLK